MNALKWTAGWMMVGGLLAAWAGCQQTTVKPTVASQCPAGCTCSKCAQADQFALAASCERAPATQCSRPEKTSCSKAKAEAARCPKAATCPKAGTPACKPTTCPSARTCFLDRVHGPKGQGWSPLCNGKDLTGWHSLVPGQPMSWKVVDGVLVNEKAHGVNIYSDQRFGDLEFYAEYRIPQGGNSGIFLRGLYEIQIIDDYGVPADKPKDSGNGGLWSLKPPSRNVSKPAGQWQSVYARLVGDRVTVVLNGEKIIEDFRLERPTYVYEELKIKPGEPGPILLQGDHKPIEFRHVMVRPVKK